jgi:hypothetical protein
LTGVAAPVYASRVQAVAVLVGRRSLVGGIAQSSRIGGADGDAQDDTVRLKTVAVPAGGAG